MKLKYYLRGLGIGIIVTTIILTISFAGREHTLSDTEIIARARELGMVMPEENDTTPDTQTGEDGAEQIHSDDADGQRDVGTTADQTADETDSQQPGTGTDDDGVDGTDQQQPVTDSDTGTEDGMANETPGVQEGTYRLTIRRGDVCRVVCENLAANGVISDSESLRLYLMEIGYASFLSTGNYDIPYGLTNEEIAEILKAGPIETE